jgi:hypothetical protein
MDPGTAARPGQGRRDASSSFAATQTADHAITMYQSQLGFLKSDVMFHFWFWIPWILLLFSADGRRPTWAVREFRRTHFVRRYMRKGVFFFFFFSFSNVHGHRGARARALCAIVTASFSLWPGPFRLWGVSLMTPYGMLLETWSDGFASFHCARVIS